MQEEEKKERFLIKRVQIALKCSPTRPLGSFMGGARAHAEHWYVKRRKIILNCASSRDIRFPLMIFVLSSNVRDYALYARSIDRTMDRINGAGRDMHSSCFLLTASRDRNARIVRLFDRCVCHVNHRKRVCSIPRDREASPLIREINCL